MEATRNVTVRDVAVPVATVGAGLVALGTMVALIWRDSPLVNDEPLYAARGLGIQVVWPGYRAPGLPFVASVIDSSDTVALRAATVASAVLLAMTAGLLTWRLSRNAAAGLVTAALLISAPGVIETAVQFLPDVPGSLVVVLAVLCVVLASDGDRLKWWSLIAIPLTLAANYMRFSSSVSIVAGLVAVALFRSQVLKRSKVVAVVLVVGVVLATGVSNFTPQPGSEDSRSAWSANKELISEKAEPLSDRGKSLVLSTASTVGLERQLSPMTPAGVVYAAGFVLAMAAALWKWRSTGPYLLWAAVTLVAYAVSLGHFETRYMVPIVVPLCCAAAVGAAELLKNRAVLLAGAIVVVSVSGVAFAAKQVVRTQDMEIEPRVARIEAAEFIRSIADGPCSLRKSEVDDSDINAEGYVGLTAVALLSKCGIDPNARQAFVVEELSPEGQSPRPPIFERSYRYFDEDAEEWYDRRLVVYRIGGAS